VDIKTECASPSSQDSRLLDAGEARGLLAEGWQAADLHVHTFHSRDVIPTRLVDPLALYLKGRRLGMTYVAFTDHDTMDAYDQIGWSREGLVPAVEVKILDRGHVGHTVHINIYTLNRSQFREIQSIIRITQDMEILTAYLQAEGLPFIFNHPFWHEPGEKPNLQAIIDIAGLFPALEYNMGRIGRINAQALKLAEVRSLGVVAATDSHVGGIGRAFTLARGDTFREFFNQIARRKSLLFPADLTLDKIKEEATLFIRQLCDKGAWLHAKDSLALDTGNSIIDGIVSSLARERSKTLGLSQWIIRRLVEALSRSGIPGTLYLRYQNNLADQIGRLLETADSAA
jgi:predicted metal-dependent phosphoesterase TrpH